ncbi:hypothetical protein OWR29_42260 [Actinoplanes sp. Pm04-4]|uniref:Uncharacterized protein n=1 Tax=Paractinoplanes pyxinae TaxID=2997416 RepID=A0ABT4BDT3_9ACTN|nr:hypothetical protein [Actinoplanes pyxinae]MCY1144664.1 hypothetical protein [Actinoplanes pyxinae]
MLVDVTPARRGIGRGLVCGAVTAVAIGLVFGQLGEYQVMDYADQDTTIGLVGALLGALGAALVIAVLPLRKRGHAVVPLVLVPVAVVPLVAGLERNNVEAALLWGCAAIAVHVLIERPRATNAVVVVLVVAALLTWGLQHRWRAQKFEAVGLPLFVPQVPGYEVNRTWAGRYIVSMTLRPDDRSNHYLDAVIRENVRCRHDDTDRWVIERETGPDALGLCLPGGAAMTVGPGYLTPDLSPLFDRITVREVDGSVLADHRNGGEMEPD